MSLDVREGEIVCLYGLMGAGRTELMEALAGRDPISGGRVLLGDQDLANLNIQERIAIGMGLVPEDRQRDGLVQTLTVGKNMSLASLLQMAKNLFIPASQSRTRRTSTARSRTCGSRLLGRTRDHVTFRRQPAEGRDREDLLTNPKVIRSTSQPGGSTSEQRGRSRPAFPRGEEGSAVLYVTSEVGEAITASHRLIVMSKGRFIREFDPRTATRDDIMAASGEHDTHYDEAAAESAAEAANEPPAEAAAEAAEEPAEEAAEAAKGAPQ